uniref:uncharacterized protein LOC120342898 isoform X2 n=1 Tax=Styela clava TaxID=7725 RepID=UPI001939ECCC|nr:uncharacterized protein LOC120342898 isoform X2 [Styela clava]
MSNTDENENEKLSSEENHTNQMAVPILPPSGDASELMLRILLEQINKFQKQTEKLIGDQNNKLEETNNQVKNQAGIIAEQNKKLEEFGEKVKDQAKIIAEQEEKFNDVKKDLRNVQNELEGFKNFQSMYKKLGGETHFYMDLEICYKMMKKEFNGNEDKLKQLESWYKKKKIMRVGKIGIATVAGGVVGGMIGGLVLHNGAVAAATTVALTGVALSPAGIILIGVGVGVVIVGISLAAYKIYRNKKMKKESEKAQVKLSIENELAPMLDQSEGNSKSL